jgi:hypothetical protein
MLRLLHYDELSKRCAGEHTYEKRRPGSSLTMNAGLLSLGDSRVEVRLRNARLSLCTSTHTPGGGASRDPSSPLQRATSLYQGNLRAIGKLLPPEKVRGVMPHTGQVCTTPGIYKSSGCQPAHSIERTIPKGHVFPPCSHCKAAITWTLVRETHTT